MTALVDGVRPNRGAHLARLCVSLASPRKASRLKLRKPSPTVASLHENQCGTNGVSQEQVRFRRDLMCSCFIGTNYEMLNSSDPADWGDLDSVEVIVLDLSQ